MNNCRKQHPRRYWHLSVTVAAGCLVAWSAVPFATAQEPESPVFVASLSVSEKPSTVIIESVSEHAGKPASMMAQADRPGPVLHREPTDGDAWAGFEAEYQLPRRNPSPVKRQLETAKYVFDTAAFTLDRFVKGIRDYVGAQLTPTDLSGTRETSRGGFWDKPQVKLDLDITHSKPYLGIRLVIPFGN